MQAEEQAERPTSYLSAQLRMECSDRPAELVGLPVVLIQPCAAMTPQTRRWYERERNNNN